MHNNFKSLIVLLLLVAWLPGCKITPEIKSLEVRQTDAGSIKQYLHENWTLKAADDLSQVPRDFEGAVFSASVPGCVHTDLLSANLIEDPYIDLAEQHLKWIGESDWEYRCQFTANSDLLARDHVDLVFEGLDTVAEIRLNNELISLTENMHVGFNFDIKSKLKPGENELVIYFHSPMRYIREWEKKLGTLPHVNKHPYNFIRKQACNFWLGLGTGFGDCRNLAPCVFARVGRCKN